MKKIVIVYGRQRTGKTTLATALANSMGARLVDEWRGAPLMPGDVAVTNIVPPPAVVGALYVRVEGVMPALAVA